MMRKDAEMKNLETRNNMSVSVTASIKKISMDHHELLKEDLRHIREDNSMQCMEWIQIAHNVVLR